MKVWRFFKYERPYLIMFAVGFLIVWAVVATDPANHLRWETALYALALLLLVWTGFFLYRYIRNLQAIRRMHEEDAEQLSWEAAHYRQLLDTMEKEHIRALNEVQAKQSEHYNYIVTWFHEIKTPISVLRLLQQTTMDPKSLEAEIDRIDHYVDQALYYAKLDSFNQDYDIRSCDLEPLVKTIVKNHSRTFISKKIRVQLQIPTTTVQSDSKWLQFIINQLLNNSLQYTGEQGEVTIGVRDTDKEKQLVIRDNGVGIEAQDIARIFNRGFTGANGRSYTKSTGMGLYLAQELSNKLGHYITCVSQAGSYTEMAVHFPKNNDTYIGVVQK